jgi:pyrroline-5-carboxylate reductase
VVIDPKPSDPMVARLDDAGVRLEASLRPRAVTAGVLMLAVKPQMMEAVLPGLKRARRSANRDAVDRRGQDHRLF